MGNTYFVDNMVEFRVTSTCSTTGADTIDTIAGGGSIAAGDPLRLDIGGATWRIFRFVTDLGGGEWQLDRNHGISYPSSDVPIKYGIYNGTAQEPSGDNGPFPTIARGLASTDAHDTLNIKKNTGYTLDNVDQIHESLSPTGTGNVANNTRVKIRGFNTTPGDMDLGGAYYQSPLDAYLSGIDSDCIVDIDGNDSAFSIMEIDAKDNIEFSNFYFHNTDKATGNQCIEVLNQSDGLLFDRCFFDDAYRAIAGTGNAKAPVDGTLIRDCYGGPTWIKPSSHIKLEGVLNFVARSMLDGCGADIMGSGGFFGNLAVGGVNVFTGNGSVFVKNNTVYNCTGGAVFLNVATALAVVQNNVLVPSQSGRAVKIHTMGGSVRNDYNCIWGADGNQLTTPFESIKSGGTVPVLGDHSIEAAPEFVDAANGDFRARNKLVLRGGEPDMAGNPTQMGAILQRYQFAQRGRLANLARLRTIR